MMNASDIPELDKRGLRELGGPTGARVAGGFGSAVPYFLATAWPVWPWVVFAVLAVWALIAPGTLNPVYRGWMRVGMLLGRVTTPIIMTLVFAITIVPMALILRILRRDFMRRKFDGSPSYRVKSRPPSVKNMEKPY